MLALNCALLGSMVQHYQISATASLRSDLFSLVVLLLFNLTVLLPALIQVSSLELSPEGMDLRTLVWRSKLLWSDIKGFSNPSTTSFAILRAKRCLYLIAKRDFSNFSELARIITSRTAPEILN
jgi:hypothetical protein